MDRIRKHKKAIIVTASIIAVGALAFASKKVFADAAADWDRRVAELTAAGTLVID